MQQAGFASAVALVRARPAATSGQQLQSGICVQQPRIRSLAGSLGRLAAFSSVPLRSFSAPRPFFVHASDEEPKDEVLVVQPTPPQPAAQPETAVESSASSSDAAVEPRALSGVSGATAQERFQRFLDDLVADLESRLDPTKAAAAVGEGAKTVGKNLISGSPLDYVVTGVQLSAMLAVAMGPSLLPDVDPLVLAVAGPGLFKAGLLLLLLGLWSLGAQNLTPFVRPSETNELSTRGAFALVRHPIYGGVLMASIGWSVEQASPTSLFFAFALYALLEWKSNKEEAYLEQYHGNAYKRYRRRVGKKFIPFII